MIREGGPVDRYLDEMFDRLAGRGAAGRRLLAETEDHLTEAVAEGRARGLDPDTAEREAVQRFGTATDVVRPVPALPATLRRLATGTWAVAGAAMLWYGLSGIVTWLAGWPWTALLIATDRFGTHPMCDRPWIPADRADCLAFHRGHLTPVPWGGARFPYALVAVLGLVLLTALVVLRRTTRVGTPAWTPARTVLALAFALPFGAAGALLLLYGVMGLSFNVQDWALSHVIAGVSALLTSLLAVRRLRAVG